MSSSPVLSIKLVPVVISLIFATCLTLYSVENIAATSEKSVAGYWASDDSIFLIETTDQTLTANIVTLLNEVYLPEEGSDRAGKPRLDDNNPDAQLKLRSLEGMAFVSDYRYEDGKWQGGLYDARSGKTYESYMSVNRKGELKMRGYIGTPFLGKTETFQPASACGTTTVALLVKPRNKSLCEKLCPAHCDI